MKYFLHDTNSFQDEKITMLFMEYGYEGLGLFYTLLEKIGLQEKPIKTEVLKRQLQVGRKLEKCWSFLEEIGLISSSNGETFNERILSYSETYQIKNQKTLERVRKFRLKQSENQEDTENVTRYETVTKRERNAPKVKESKVNKSKGLLLVVRKNISVTPEEKEKLSSELGEEKMEACFDYLSNYKIEKNYKTQSDYLTIKRWVVKAVNENEANGTTHRRGIKENSSSFIP
jgi:hypothetical protein